MTNADQAAPGEARKLASIVSIDISGYSRLAETDEAAAIAAVRAVRARIDRAVAGQDGRLFSSAGDGFMLEFSTASAAVLAAEQIVAGEGPAVRAGVHMGEVSTTGGGDLLGHGVNIAARLQQMAPPGAVLVSADVHRSLRGDLRARLTPRGTVRLDKMEETLPIFLLDARVHTPARRLGVDWRWAAAGALGALTLAVAAITVMSSPQPARAARVAVLPFRTLGDDASLHAFADGLSDRIVNALSSRSFLTVSPDDAIALRGPNAQRRRRELGVDLVLDGAIQGADPVSVDARIEDPSSHNVLWSLQLQDRAANAVSLQARVTARITAEMYCGQRAFRSVGGLSDPTALSAYLKACDLFLVHSDDNQSTYQLLSSLRQVTSIAPQFSAAHSDIAKYEAYFLGEFPDDQIPSLRRDIETEAHRALALDPHNADAYVALSLLLEPGHWTQSERVLRQGLAVDPDWPHANGFLGNLLTEVGRIQEASVHYQRAAAANPVSGGLSWSGQSAIGLSNIGRDDLADRAVDEIERLWANDDLDIWRVRLQIAESERQWDEGLAMLDQPSRIPKWVTPANIASYRSFFLAAKAGTRPRVEAERQRLVALASQGPSGFPIIALASLGYIDDIFAILDRRSDAQLVNSSLPDYLFTPPFAPLRRDSRFMRLAARLGLIDYWRTAGVQPDFCNEPSLPYDCVAEEQRVQPVTHR